MPACGSCAREVEARFRYCPWCAAPLRLKLVEFFPANALEGEHGMALRVSRYLADAPEERHVRFSVWSEQGSPRLRSRSTTARPTGWPSSCAPRRTTAR